MSKFNLFNNDNMVECLPDPIITMRDLIIAYRSAKEKSGLLLLKCFNIDKQGLLPNLRFDMIDGKACNVLTADYPDTRFNRKDSIIRVPYLSIKTIFSMDPLEHRLVIEHCEKYYSNFTPEFDGDDLLLKPNNLVRKNNV